MFGRDAPRDFFDRARSFAVAVMFAAGALAVAGSMLPWVAITAQPEILEGADFGRGANLEEPPTTRPFSGLEARDGWWTLAGGAAMCGAALGLLVRRRAAWAWAGLLAATLVGAVGIADYRGIGDLSSSLSRRMEIVGEADPGVGIVLVLAGALAGVVGAVAGIAASPRPSEGERA